MLRLEINEGIASVTMCHGPVNALSRPWADRFFEILDQLDQRADWRVLLIRSSEKVFSAGGDIKQYASRLEREDAGDLLAEEASIYQKLFARISDLPQISIAEIGGVAAGGGLELALCCDVRIASTSARLGLPEVGVGLLPAAGGTQRITKLCGAGVAFRLVGGAELITGSEALACGLVEWAVAPEEVAGKAADIARRFATQPPEALQAAKACIKAAGDAGIDGFALELTYPPKLMKTSATKNKIQEFLARQK